MPTHHLSPQEIQLISLDAGASFLLVLTLAERKGLNLSELAQSIEKKIPQLGVFNHLPKAYLPNFANKK